MVKRRKHVKRSFGLNLKKATVFSITQIVFFAMALLIVVSFARQGLILVRINDALVSYFSWTTIFLPVVFLSFAFLLSKIKFPLAQPNVLVGGLLFFISISTLARAGIAGGAAWDGISSFITPVGSFIVLLGTAIAGLIILFNTSLDQAFNFFLSFFKSAKRFTVGDKNLGKVFPRQPFRVLGENPGLQPASARANSPLTAQPLTEEIVQNRPGEQVIWKYPPIDLLSDMESGKADRGDIKGNAATIEQTLEAFGITAHVVEVNAGPAVTQYALEVAQGTKLSKITSLERDLALALAAPTGTIRIEAPIPGRNLVGIELPNKSPEFVP